MDSPNHQFETEVEYKDGDKGTGAWAIKPGPAEVPEIPGDDLASEDFEGALWSQITFFGGDWITTAAEAHNGTLSYTNLDIDDNETSSFFIFNDVGATELRFWLKTDTETGFDKFNLFVDFVDVFEESGPTDWQLVIFPLAAAFETIEFRYTKDSSASVFSDACYVDEIVLGLPGTPGIPARPFVYTPLKMTDDGERLKVDVLDQTLSVTGRALDCALDSVTICTDDPIQVTILDQPIAVTGRALDCALDSVTICTDGPLQVTVLDQPIAVTGRALDCSLDSVSICTDSPIQVEILDQPIAITGLVAIVEPVTVDAVNLDIRDLACATDSVTVCMTTGTATNGSQVSTSGSSAVSILAANSNRKGAVIQNIGAAAIRIGVSGVTATTGIFRLLPGDIAFLNMPYCPDEELFMIREGAVNGTVLVSEQT